MSRCIFLVLAALSSVAADWNRDAAAKYLDDRCKTWFEFHSADRGEGATKTSCLCCHTVVPYALARPSFKDQPTALEKKLLEQTKLRVENWADLDSPQFKLFYDSNAVKKKESLGTEAVLNALLLATQSRHRGDVVPDASLKKAFANLWQVQAADGAWEWLDFKLEPWESPGARYYGACLAAVAIGSAPGEVKSEAGAALLKKYLKANLPTQPIFNKAWALAASASLDGVLTADQRKEIAEQLLARQQDDGGWNLASLGPYSRRDKSEQPAASDGYATGFVLFTLQNAGLSKDAKVERGRDWLRKHQEPTGEWKATSLNKQRNPTSHVGKFMTDAATAYAVLALSP